MSEHVSDEQLSLLIDGQLSLAAPGAVTAHVRACPPCAARHDALIELTAVMRLQQPLRWLPPQTQAAIARVRSRPLRPKRLRAGERDWTLAFAGLLAAGGVLASVLLVPGVFGGLAHGSMAALSALLPGGGLVSSGHLLVALAAIALLGFAALPLSRSR